MFDTSVKEFTLFLGDFSVLKLFPAFHLCGSQNMGGPPIEKNDTVFVWWEGRLFLWKIVLLMTPFLRNRIRQSRGCCLDDSHVHTVRSKALCRNGVAGQTD